jgi:hypothetical protein
MDLHADHDLPISCCPFDELGFHQRIFSANSCREAAPALPPVAVC